MNALELYGYLFVVASSPIQHTIGDWYPLIFNEHNPNFASDDEAQWVQERIVSIHAELVRQVNHDQVHLPKPCQPLRPPMANFEGDAALSHWASGVIEGHDWLSEVWRAYLTPKLDGELSACLMVLSFFADINLAEAYCQEYAHAFSSSVEEMAEMVVETLDHAIVGYAGVGKTLAKHMESLPQDAPVTLKKDYVAICPCGSGKPFQVCCLH